MDTSGSPGTHKNQRNVLVAPHLIGISQSGRELIKIMAKHKVKTSVKMSFKNVTLDKHALIELCKIVMKAANDDPSHTKGFEIEGKSELVKADSLESLENARFPRDLHSITLWAHSWANGNEIRLSTMDLDSGFMSFSEVAISSRDVDWVAARKEELEQFVSDHKNYHWIFQNWFSIIVQVILLSTLIGYLIRDNQLNVLIAMFSGYAYFYITRRTFPTIVLDTGRPSGLKTFRKFLAVIIPLLLIGLLVNLIWNLISSG